MSWSQEKLEKVPEVYRDFMQVLRAVPDSRGSALQITGIPLGKVFNALAPKYGYTPAHVRELAERLKKARLIEEDPKFGFVWPTPEGEEMIRAIAGSEEPAAVAVPELPEF